MFAKLKQKIEKEGGLTDLSADKYGSTSDLTSGASRKQRVTPSPLPDDISPTIHQSAHSMGEGAQRGPRLTKRLSSTASESENLNKFHADERIGAHDGAHTAERADSIIGSSATSKEELLEMLVRRTKQVKSLDSKLADLGVLLKEKNQMIEKLETALEKQQDVLCQRVQELNEQYHNGRAKMSENIAAAVRKKELEMKEKIESLEKDLLRAHTELRQQKIEGGCTDVTCNQSSDLNLSLSSEMRQKIEELENKNQMLRDDMEKLKSENASLEKQLKASKDDFAQMALQNSQEDWLEKQIENETNLSALDSQLQKLKAELTQRENEKSSLVRQLSDKVSELSEAKKSLARLEEKQLTAESVEQQLRQSLVAAQQLSSQLQTEKATVESREVGLIQQCDSYRAELSEARQQYEEKLTNQDQVIQKLNDQLEVKEAETVQLEDKIKSLETERDTAAVDSGKVQQLTSDVEKLDNQLLEKNRIIKKLEQRLNDMKKLVQRELKVCNAPGGAQQQHLTASGATSGREASNHLPSDSNGLRPNLSANSLHSGSNPLGNGSEAGGIVSSGVNTGGIGSSDSKIRPSESYPNFSMSNVALQPQNNDNPIATLPVSYSVTQLHYNNNVSYTNNPTTQDDDVEMLGVEQSSTLSAENTSVHLATQRLANDTREAAAFSKDSSGFGTNPGGFKNLGGEFGSNSRNPGGEFGTNNTSLTRSTARSLTADEIAELMGGGVGALSRTGRGGDYELSKELNLKYLRHVILKFLLSRESEAIHLLRALSTLLEFTEEEQKLLKDTLQWKMSWFGSRPQVPDRGQTAKVIPPTAFS